MMRQDEDRDFQPGLKGRSRWILLPLWLAGLLVIYLGAASAMRAVGQPLPSFFLDPFGHYVIFTPPGWDAERLHLRATDLLVAIDGVPIGTQIRPDDLPGARAYRRLAALHQQGKRAAELTFSRHGGALIRVQVPLRTLAPDEVFYFAGCGILIAIFDLSFLTVVLLLAGRRPATHGYVLWSLSFILLLPAFLDHFTQASLLPLTPVACALMAEGLLIMAYAFPHPPRRLRTPALLCLLGASAALLAITIENVLAHHMGREPYPLLPHWSTAALSAAPTIFIGSCLLRARRSAAQERAELLSVLVGPVVILVPVAAFLLLGTFVWDQNLTALFTPFGSLPISLSMGYALIRHNVLGVDGVLSRRLMILPYALLSLPLSFLLAFIGQRARGTEGMLLMTLLLATPMFFLFRWLGDRLFFLAMARFRPTIAQLADLLVVLHARIDIVSAIQAVVCRWLPVQDARVHEPRDVTELPNLPRDAALCLAEGQTLWTQERPGTRTLLVPMLSQGALRGVLAVAPKQEGALYTSADLDLLKTVANLGAVALHNAQTLDELESLQRTELRASRADKTLTVDTLCTEISHEVSLPLSLFRHLLDEIRRGGSLDTGYLEAGGLELLRLERMLETLRHLQQVGGAMAAPPAEVAVLGPVLRARYLLREQLRAREVMIEIDVPAELRWRCDADALVQVFANLLRNAAQAVAPGGKIGVRPFCDGGCTGLEVWDQGPGVPEAQLPLLFVPGRSTREGGMGLGLAICCRIVSGLGFTLTHHRLRGETCFRIGVPPEITRDHSP